MFNNVKIHTYIKYQHVIVPIVDVNYSPDGQMSTFKNGQPTHTKLSLSFVEDRIITKRDIEAGA